MTEKPSFFERFNTWIRQSVTLRLITIGILLLFLLIPVSMIEHLIAEREHRKAEATEEVSSKWGQAQTVEGLVLTIPVRTYSKVFEGGGNEKFHLVESISYVHFLPDVLDIKGNKMDEITLNGNEWQIDLSLFPSGEYMLLIQTKEGKTYKRSIIKI